MKKRRPRKKPLLRGFRVGALKLDPGDFLILRAKERISDDQARRLKDYMEMLIKPTGVKVIALGNDLDIMKLTLPKPEDSP